MKITKTGIKRVLRGRKGITKKGVEITRKNILLFAKNKARKTTLMDYKKKIRELEKELKKHPDNIEKQFELNAIKLMAEMVEKEKVIVQPFFNKAIILKGTKLSESLSTKYGLDAIGEFNPQTRKHIRNQMEKIINAFEKRDVFSVSAGAKAAKEIEKTLGKRKARLFLRKSRKTGIKLIKMLNKLLKNPTVEEIIS